MEPLSEALKNFETIVPFGEEAFMVLRAHLLAEHHLFAYVSSRASDSAFLKDIKSRYSPVGAGLGLILLAQALSLRDDVPPSSSEVLWPALKSLNELRNTLAHELHPKQSKIVEKMQKFIELVSGGSGTGSNLNQSFYACAQALIAYIAIDQQPLTIEDTLPDPHYR